MLVNAVANLTNVLQMKREHGTYVNNLHNTHFSYLYLSYMSLVMRKPAFCICENKDADQLRGNREADQRICFRFTDSTIPLLPTSEISSL